MDIVSFFGHCSWLGWEASCLNACNLSAEGRTCHPHAEAEISRIIQGIFSEPAPGHPRCVVSTDWSQIPRKEFWSWVAPTPS